MFAGMPGILFTTTDPSVFSSTNNDPSVKPLQFPADLDFSVPIGVKLQNGREFQVAALYQLSNRRFGNSVACAPITDGVATKDQGAWVELSWDSVLASKNRDNGILGAPTNADDDVVGWDDFGSSPDRALSPCPSSLTNSDLDDDIDYEELYGHPASDDDELIAPPTSKRPRQEPESNQFGAYRSLLESLGGSIGGAE